MTVGLCAAATAVAGTGIGAVFNLGQVNSVNATSKLTGSTSAASMLDLQNTNTNAGSTALSLKVPAGRAPLTVNSSTKVPSLNADLLDNLGANGISRGTGTTTFNYHPLEDGRATLQTVTLTAPQNGFVVLTGSAGGFYGEGCSGLCVSRLVLRDTLAGASTETPAIPGTAPAGTTTTVYVPLSTSHWLPAAKGTHTYELVGTWFGPGPKFMNPSLNAVFVPYNGAGTTAVTRPAAQEDGGATIAAADASR